MDLVFSTEDENFRQEVKTFISDNYPDDLRTAQQQRPPMSLSREHSLMWQKVLAKKGWVAPTWPKEWGGTDWTPSQHYIFAEEMAFADTLALVPFGLSMLAPVLLNYGSQAQKERFLPDIYHGNTWWCQGYSEPGAGSDLANLRTRARRMQNPDGSEYYLVNGQKTWTTHGQHADWGFFLVRTDTSAKPQAGISFLLIDLRSPGVSVKPIITCEGGHEVNDVFLEDVKVPIENRVHDENKGWDCAKALLQYERTSIAGVARLKRMVQKLKAIAAIELNDQGIPLIKDPTFLRKITRFDVDLEALAMTELRVLFQDSGISVQGTESSMLKLIGTELKQGLSELFLEVVGLDAMPFAPSAEANNGIVPDYARQVTWDYFSYRKLSIYGGSNEIQRNIVAKLALRS